ncbi:MAG: type II toxin-antitoxin system VapC family toxin [Deltaproteobacteria bacterium]|nr:type II toxin-antitoxin system VapC family toxin [Deltaproteobacteria bacterium]
MALSFIDTNIFMYSVGQAHPFKEPSEAVIRGILNGEIEGVINAEVLQEVLYRYSSIGKSKIGYNLFDTMVNTFSQIWVIEKEDAVEARKMMEKLGIKTRDAIHAATMKRNGVTSIYSFDSDFDDIAWIKRIIPS